MVDEPKTATDGDGRENGGKESSRVSFSPEQQSKVQELIDEAYRKAYTKASGGDTEEVDRLRGEVENLKEEKKTSALLRAISRHGVVDAEEVTELLRNRVRYDDSGNVTVVGNTGSTQIDPSGRPLGLEEFVDSWLAERPHHLRTSGKSGGGSPGSRFTGEGRARHDLSDPSSWRSMPREDLDRILSEGINIQGSGGQTYRFRDVKNPFEEARKRKQKGSITAGSR